MRGIGLAMENKEMRQEQEQELNLMQEQEQELDQKEGKSVGRFKSKLMVCLLYVAVLSAATYAWFTLNNKPRVYNLTLTAGASADLLIADDLGTGPGEYGDELDLKGARHYPTLMDEMELNPVTTADVKTFHEPVYTGNAVTAVNEITDEEMLYTSYVFQKTFYLKAGSLKSGSGKKVTKGTRYYDIMLLGPKQEEEYSGCVIEQAAGSNTEGGATAANSLRIAFIVENAQQDEIIVYEPNSDQHNSGDKADNQAPSDMGAYKTMKQPAPGADFEGGENGNSETMFTIEEEVDVKVTMLVWVEGTDEDCTNSIQLDEIVGNIQFISKDAVSATRR